MRTNIQLNGIFANGIGTNGSVNVVAGRDVRRLHHSSLMCLPSGRRKSGKRLSVSGPKLRGPHFSLSDRIDLTLPGYQPESERPEQEQTSELRSDESQRTALATTTATTVTAVTGVAESSSAWPALTVPAAAWASFAVIRTFSA